MLLLLYVTAYCEKMTIIITIISSVFPSFLEGTVKASSPPPPEKKASKQA